MPLATLSGSTATRSDVARICADDKNGARIAGFRSEEHTSELQSQSNIVCRLLPAKKKPSCSRSPAVTRPPHSTSKAAALPGPDRPREALALVLDPLASPLTRSPAASTHRTPQPAR